MRSPRSQMLANAKGNADRAVALVKASPDGVKMAEMCKHLGLASQTVRDLGRRLIAAGRIASVGGTVNHRYCMPDQVERLDQALRATSELRRKTRQRRRYDAAKRKSRKRAKAMPKHLPLDVMVQRRVPATAAQPLPKLGPSSVFELGAKL